MREWPTWATLVPGPITLVIVVRGLIKKKETLIAKLPLENMCFRVSEFPSYRVTELPCFQVSKGGKEGGPIRGLELIM